MQDIMSLNDIRAALQDRNLRAVSVCIGLNYHTIWRVAKGIEDNPRLDTLRRLSDYLSTNKRTCA
jgi:hypothetical protein